MMNHVQTDRHIDRTSRATRNPSPGFTLVEVMIAAIILALGLVGLAAVFPAVISQQQAANDLIIATSVSATADGLLATRLPAFRSRLNDPIVIRQLGTNWQRINGVEAREGRVFYLQTPVPPGGPDMRLRESALHVVPEFGIGGGSPRNYAVRLPRGPISEDLLPDDLVVTVYTDTMDFDYVPDASGPSRLPTKFKEGRNAAGRLNPGGPNSIDYRNARLVFHFNLFGPEQVDHVEVRYRWLNDRIVSHPDRLYPTDSPRYGWEMAFRRSIDGQFQYTTFVYRFDGLNAPFVPEIPGRFGIDNNTRAGMLRLDSGLIIYNPTDDRYELHTSAGGLADHVEPGAWLLPVEGTNPIRVRRSLPSTTGSPKFELEGPPVKVRPDGVSEPMLGRVDFWYMPARIKAFSDQGQEIGIWRIRPLIAITKQVKL